MWSLLISFLLFSNGPAPVADEVHDFHVSRLMANYKPSEGRIECTLMTFVDDLERVLAKHHQLAEVGEEGDLLPSKEKLNLTEAGEHPSVDSLVSSYLKDVLKLTSTSSPQALEISYIGKERDDDPYGMFIYFVVESVKRSPPQKAGSSTKLELQSTYMLELYEDQQNVVVWKLNGESADYDLLTFNTRTCDFER